MNKTDSLILLYLKGNGWTALQDLVNSAHSDVGCAADRVTIRSRIMALYEKGLLCRRFEGGVAEFKEKE